MVREVEEFGAELEASSLRNPKLLEERPVQTMEPRTNDLRRRASQRGEVGLSDGGSGRWVCKGRRVHPLVNIVFTRVPVLTRDEQSIAAHPRRSGGDTN